MNHFLTKHLEQKLDKRTQRRENKEGFSSLSLFFRKHCYNIFVSVVKQVGSTFRYFILFHFYSTTFLLFYTIINKVKTPNS